MKIKSLYIKNIGMIVEETIVFNQPLLLFYGAVKQGKSTILNAVRWVFGGQFPQDIIRHGEKEAEIRLLFENGELTRSFYYSPASKEVEARPLRLMIDGVKVARPSEKMQALLNPFLLNQDFLARMTELERKKYFVDLFNTATPELDKEFAKANADAAELRIQIKTYGDIKPVEVKRVDPAALIAERSRRLAENARTIATHNFAVETVKRADRERHDAMESLTEYQKDERRLIGEIMQLQNQLDAVRTEISAGSKWVLEHPVQSEPALPALQDTLSLDQQISEAGATNVRAENYERDRARLNQKIADEQAVVELERRQREIRDEKIRRLDAIADQSGVPGLEFTEDGGFLYEDTTPGMLSTSQIMRLSAALSEKYPQDLGVGLIDRAESLGTSIMEFVEKARSEHKTILATIVGEKPAVNPPDVGVFVVKNGKVSQ